MCICMCGCMVYVIESIRITLTINLLHLCSTCSPDAYASWLCYSDIALFAYIYNCTCSFVTVSTHNTPILYTQYIIHRQKEKGLSRNIQYKLMET